MASVLLFPPAENMVVQQNSGIPAAGIPAAGIPANTGGIPPWLNTAIRYCDNLSSSQIGGNFAFDEQSKKPVLVKMLKGVDVYWKCPCCRFWCYEPKPHTCKT